MALINFYDIDTAYGLKSIELHQADVSKPDFRADLLVVSAFQHGYSPTPGTVLGALKTNCGIDMHGLASSPEIDLRGSLHVWLSGELIGHHFRRIACVEIVGASTAGDYIEQSLKNIFSLIAMADMQDICLQSIAFPLLGTGNQMIDPAEVLPGLIRLSVRSLINLGFLKKVCFIERSDKKVALIDAAMNTHFDRTGDDTNGFSETDFRVALYEDMNESLSRLRAALTAKNKPVPETLAELQAKFHQTQIRPFEIGLLGRRLAEDVVKDLLELKTLTFDLSRSIGELNKKRIALWIQSYLHIMRVFGNHAAHSGSEGNVIPPGPKLKDLTTVIFCINRVLDFWGEHTLRQPDNP